MTDVLRPVMQRVYLTLTLVALGLIATWGLGGSQALSWGVLVLALVIIAAGFKWVRRDRRRGDVVSWSPVFLGGSLACLALARETRPTIAIPLLAAGVTFMVLTGRAVTRDVRRAQALLDDAYREIGMRPPDASS
jgi:hypothetical protein